MKRLIILLLSATAVMSYATGQRLEKFKYSDMDEWVTRTIKESAIIGGDTKNLYEIGPTQTIKGDIPYVNKGGSPWATSNVMAKVSGVTKTSNAVYFEDRAGNGKCAKLCTVIERVRALGIINMKVLVSGSIFLGRIFEPIKSTSNPYSKMEMGIPYSKRPDFLAFDYKVTVPNSPRVYSSGFGKQKTLAGQDYAEVYVILQKRWEDSDGNLHALRVGTGRERFGKTIAAWNNAHRLPIHYGDITKQPFFKQYMGLISKDNSYYARNSKGEMVPVVEEGWANAEETPTHILIMASSGCGTAYVGTPGMTFWIDNIALGFNE